MWEMKIAEAIEEAVFFIPIVTPRAVVSKHCKFEFDRFLARERALGRNDLVFPIHYIRVPDLQHETKWRDDPVLSIVAKRQYVDWLKYRHDSVNTTAFRRAIDRFCEKIAETLRQDERRSVEADARQRAEHDERVSQETEAQRQAEERARLSEKALAKKRAEEKGRREESHAPANVSPLTAAQERALEAGDLFRKGADSPEMIVVPAGRFLLGSPADQGDDDEHPQHGVTITKPFAVSKFALTFDGWDACAARGGCRSDVSDSGWGRGRRPAINVSWDDAGVRQMALEDHRQALSAAVRGRVRICGARRQRDEISLGRRHQIEWESDGQWLRQPMGREADGAGRLLRPESIRSLRHDRQRLVVDGGLLEPKLQGSAGRRHSMDDR